MSLFLIINQKQNNLDLTDKNSIKLQTYSKNCYRKTTSGSSKEASKIEIVKPLGIHMDQY